jgi:predicted secreted protein
MTLSGIVVSVSSTVLGFILKIIYDIVREKMRFRRELQQNQQMDLTGENWFAAWQTSVGNEELLNTEDIIIKQKGALIKMHNREKSPENPKAGFRWEGQLTLFQGRDLMGHYFSVRAEQNTNKGIMYFHYDSAKKQLVGPAVGCRKKEIV